MVPYNSMKVASTRRTIAKVARWGHSVVAPALTLAAVAFLGSLRSVAADTIGFAAVRQTGSISVASVPPDADIVLDGARTGLFTPAILTDVPVGPHTIELSVPDYLFSRQRVTVLPDTTVTVSFELITGLDTTLVIGQLRLGLMVMPRPPMAVPYVVDGRAQKALDATLNEGRHHVEWDGGNRYTSLDTIVEVFAGRASTFDFRPRRRTATLIVQPFPGDAEIFIDSRSSGYGTVLCTLATGDYTVGARRKGYDPRGTSVTLLPDRQAYVGLDLMRIEDRDEDGFLDSADRCPDMYGLYGGCPSPQRRQVHQLNALRVVRNMRIDPLTITVNSVGYMHRTPTNQEFNRFLGHFTAGKAYLNNHRGFTAANSYTVSFRGVLVAVELGQWNSPLEYDGRDTVSLLGGPGGGYLLVFDTLNQALRPRVVIPSTTISAGVHFRMKWFTIAYTFGYQFEDILIFDLLAPGDSTGTTVRFDNDGIIHQLRLEADLTDGGPVVPSAYGAFSLAIGRSHPTGWHAIQFGIQMKFVPGRRRGHSKVAKEAHQ